MRARAVQEPRLSPHSSLYVPDYCILLNSCSLKMPVIDNNMCTALDHSVQHTAIHKLGLAVVNYNPSMPVLPTVLLFFDVFSSERLGRKRPAHFGLTLREAWRTAADQPHDPGA